MGIGKTMKHNLTLVLGSAILVTLFATLVGCGKGKPASPNYSASVSNRLAAIKQSGQPVTREELNAWYAAPAPADDAAKLYMEVFTALTKDDPQSTAFLPRNSKAVKLLLEASKRNGCRYPIDFTKGANTLMPHLANLKKSAQLLRAEAVAQAGRGKMDECCQALTAQLRLANSLEKEPTLLSQLVRIAVTKIALESLEICLSCKAFDNGQLLRLKNALPDSTSSALLTPGIVGQCCSVVDVFQSPADTARDMASTSGDTSGLVTALKDYEKSPRRHEDFDTALRYYEAMLAAADKGFPDALDMAASAGALIETAKTSGLVLSPVVIAGGVGDFRKAAMCAAYLRDAQVALAIERYRIKHNDALPVSLDSLVPDLLDAVPTDPFTGNPLSYTKSSGKGYVVYSFGPDKQDDSGSPVPKGGKATEGGDLSFSVTR